MSINKRSIDAVSWGCDRIDVFGIGGTNHVHHKYWDYDAFSTVWADLGGVSMGPPAVVSAKKGEIDVFYRGTNRKAYTKHFENGKWSDWINLAGGLSTNLAVASKAPNHVIVCSHGGPDGVQMVCKNRYDGVWDKAWEYLNGGFKSEAAVVSSAPGNLDAFGIGGHNAVYVKSNRNGVWDKSWKSLGGNFDSPPTVVSWGGGRLDVFGVNTAGTPQHKYFSGGAWSEWKSLGGGLATAISAQASTFLGLTRIDLFALGGDKALYTKIYDGVKDEWGSWMRHDGEFISEPVVRRAGADRLDVFAVGKGGEMRHQFWNASGWIPSKTTRFDEKGGFKVFA